jgi:uncharacterized membrane protein
MQTEPTMFQALIVPHRSLSRRGLRLVMGGLTLMCCVPVAISVLTGAWPISGFAGAELFLAGFLLRRNARDVRSSELVLLSESGLRIIRTDIRGQQRERRLAPTWLNVDLQDRPGRVPLLLLSAQGRRVEVGGALGEAEKRALAAELAAALHRWRNPVFDNPQLRE